ncbi:MAG: restriction endonuclease subunit S [Myxococcota bacterium]
MTPHPTVRFGDLYQIPSRNGLYKGAEWQGRGARIVNMGEIFGYDRIGPQEMARVEVTDGEFERFGLKHGDLLFARRSLVEAGAGRCVLVTELPEPTVFESSIIRVRLDPTRCDPAFYLYYFRAGPGRAAIAAIVNGVAQKGIRGSELENIQIACPPLGSQRRIAATLAAYDDLIDVNERRIRLLEESVRVLYREWFERLRFPGHQRVAVKDGVPEGWSRAAFRQLVDEVRRAAPIEKIAAETPYVGLEHVPRRSLALADWGTAAEVTSGKLWFRRGEILFGKIRPYFHKVVVAPMDGVCSSDIIVFVPREGWSGLAAAVASSDAFVAHASKTSGEGARMPRANPRMLLDWPVLLPDAATASAFEEFVTPRIDQMNLLRAQSRAAARARDFLLPRLMDGTLTPPDVAVVEAVG